jgi:magnesium transporter
MLIHCAAYQDGKRLGAFAIEKISEYLHRPHCFLWVAMRDPGDAELAEMQQMAGINLYLFFRFKKIKWL